MMKFQNVFFLVATAFVLVGCMTPGQQLASSAIQQLREGQTQGEVRAIFGSPAELVSDEKGNLLEIFQFAAPQTISESRFKTIELRTLHVLYDPQGRVKKFVSHVGELKGYIGHGNKWRAGRPFEPEKLNSIQRGLTTRDELIEMFGPAPIEGISVDGRPGARWIFGTGAGLNEHRRHELTVWFDEAYVVQGFITRDMQQ